MDKESYVLEKPKMLWASKLFGSIITPLVAWYKPPVLDTVESADKILVSDSINSVVQDHAGLVLYSQGLPKYRLLNTETLKNRIKTYAGQSYLVLYENGQPVVLQISDTRGYPEKSDNTESDNAKSVAEFIQQLQSKDYSDADDREDIKIKDQSPINYAINIAVNVCVYLGKTVFKWENMAVTARHYKQIGQNFFLGIEAIVKDENIEFIGLKNGRPRIQFNAEIIDSKDLNNDEKADYFVKKGDQVYFITYGRVSGYTEKAGEVLEKYPDPQIVKVNLPDISKLNPEQQQKLQAWLSSLGEIN